MKLKNPIKTYGWWLKIIGAALLLVLGLWICFDRALGETIVVGFTGAVVVIYALIRIIPLIKTLKSKRSVAINIIEMVFDFIVGILLFVAAIMIQKDSENWFAEFMGNYYKYFLGAVLYLRGVTFFVETVLYKEQTDRYKFWIHIACMTLGCIVVALDGFNAAKLALVIAILSLICAAAFMVDGGFHYFKYRNKIKEEREEKTKDKGLEAPGVDKPKEEDITPEDKKDIDIVPTDTIIDKDKPEDRPYVN